MISKFGKSSTSSGTILICLEMNGQICATLISGPPGKYLMNIKNYESIINYNLWHYQSKGVGKTTIIKKVAKYLSEKEVTYEGFYTEELRDSNPPYNRLGFDIVKLNSEDREILARDRCGLSSDFIEKLINQ